MEPRVIARAGRFGTLYHRDFRLFFLGMAVSPRIVFSTTMADSIATFFGSATTLLPIFAQEILRVGPKGLGFLYGTEAVGAVAAGTWLSAVGSVRAKGSVQVSALAVYGAATAVFGISRSFPLTLAMLFVAGATDTVSTVLKIRSDKRQRRTTFGVEWPR